MKLTFIFIIIFQLTYGQHPTNCLVYQYEGSDSAKKTITLKITYNNKGLKTSEKYTEYIQPTFNLKDGTYLYYYKDTLLVKQEHICSKPSSCASYDGNMYDTTRTLYYFNDNKQLTKKQTFDYVRQRIQKSNRSNTNTDEIEYKLEKKGTWINGSAILSIYSDKGKKIEDYIPNKNDSLLTKWIWQYNEDGKVIKHSYLRGARIISVDNYNYFINGYSFTTNSQSYGGREENSLTTTVKLDSIGREIEKTLTLSASNSFIQGTKTFYNSSGLISRTISTDDNGQLLTHIYVYE